MAQQITLSFTNERFAALTRFFGEGSETDGLQKYCNQLANYHRDRFAERDKSILVNKIQKLPAETITEIVTVYCPAS